MAGFFTPKVFIDVLFLLADIFSPFPYPKAMITLPVVLTKLKFVVLLIKY